MTITWANFVAWQSSIQTIIFAVGVVVTLVQLRGWYKVSRLQTLCSLNERLGRFVKANHWIKEPGVPWSDLDIDARYEIINFIAVYEDIGQARKLGLITKDDFRRNYGGRFENLHQSGRLQQAMAEYGGTPTDFDNLRIISADIGKRFGFSKEPG